MPGFPFTTIEPNRLGRVSKFDIPVNEWVGHRFSQGFNDNAWTAVYNRAEDAAWDDDNVMRPDVANRAFGIEGYLDFKEPISAQRARLINERKQRELENLAYLESASHSWYSPKAVVGFGASMVGNLANPIDIGLAFLPFVGSEKMAAGVAKMGGSTWRQALYRGVIPEEALGSTLNAKLSGSVIDGVLSQALVEIPIAVQKYRDQAIYGPEDSALNILGAGVLSGAFRAFGLALEGMGKAWEEADPRIKDAATVETIRSMVDGVEPRVHRGFSVDENVIRNKAIFDEAGARAEAEAVIDELNPRSEEDIALEQANREAGFEQRVDQEREKAINDFIANRKAEFERGLKDEVDEETRLAIASVRAEKEATPSKALETHKPTTDVQKQTAAIEAEVKALEQDLIRMAETPEAQTRIKEEIAEDFKEIDALDASKVAEVMIPCVTVKARG